MMPYVLGLGANLDQPQNHIDQAIEALCENKLIACSSIYSSTAMLPAENDTPQPDYINMVIAIESYLTPEQMLNRIHSIEYQHGRVRTKRWQARTLDIDILLYSNIRYLSNRLTIPHKHMLERNFVFQPLLEIRNQLPIPMQTLCPDTYTKNIAVSHCTLTGKHKLTTT